MSYSSSQDPAASALIDRLLTIDPAAVMEMQSVSARSSFGTVASKWASQDFTAYAEWVDKQTVPETRNAAAAVVIDRLREESHFEEAVEWAMSSGELRQGHLPYVVSAWRRNDPAGAGEWLKSAPLTEKERAQFQLIDQP